MSKHHHHDKKSHEPDPATVINASESTDSDLKGAKAEKADAQTQSQSSDAKATAPKSEDAKASMSSSTETSADAVNPTISDEVSEAKARWREVAGKASAKLSELFDEGKAKVAQGAAEVSKRVAGAADEGIDEAFEAVRAKAKEMMEKGKTSRVRISLRERQLTEIPVAALAAAEAASLWWFGPLRMVLGHVVGRAVLDFDFVSPADPHVAEGKAFLASGDLTDAMKSFDKALELDHTSAQAHFSRGVLLKISGDKEGAKTEFQRAEECDQHGELGAKARKIAAKFA